MPTPVPVPAQLRETGCTQRPGPGPPAPRLAGPAPRPTCDLVQHGVQALAAGRVEADGDGRGGVAQRLGQAPAVHVVLGQGVCCGGDSSERGAPCPPGSAARPKGITESGWQGPRPPLRAGPALTKPATGPSSSGDRDGPTSLGLCQCSPPPPSSLSLPCCSCRPLRPVLSPSPQKRPVSVLSAAGIKAFPPSALLRPQSPELPQPLPSARTPGVCHAALGSVQPVLLRLEDEARG